MSGRRPVDGARSHPHTQVIEQMQKFPKSEIHWPSVLQLGLSLVGLLLLWGLSLALALLGVVQYFTDPGQRAGGLALLLMAAGAGLSGALLLPSAGYALARLLAHPAAIKLPTARFLRPTLLILALPLVLLLGHWVSRIDLLAWLALPLLHLLAIGLPVWWLLELGRRDLPVGSPQRLWGVFGSGLVLGPALIFVAELVALLVFVLLAALWIARDPVLVSQLTLLAERIGQVEPSPEALARAFGPYLARPGVIYASFAFGCVIVPLIEEAIKPVGVWLLAGRPLTPAGGFTAGILSGAGYALFESLALGNSVEEWATLAFARAGTAVIHILTTGLTGWALVLAWREGRYLRLGLTYLAVVLLHGLWNSLAIALSFNGLLEAAGRPNELPEIAQVGRFAPYGLAALSATGLFLLLWANWIVRRNRGEPEPPKASVV